MINRAHLTAATTIPILVILLILVVLALHHGVQDLVAAPHRPAPLLADRLQRVHPRAARVDCAAPAAAAQTAGHVAEHQFEDAHHDGPKRGQAAADNADAGLDGAPDEDVGFGPGYVCGLAEARDGDDAVEAGEADEGAEEEHEADGDLLRLGHLELQDGGDGDAEDADIAEEVNDADAEVELWVISCVIWVVGCGTAGGVCMAGCLLTLKDWESAREQ